MTISNEGVDFIAHFEGLKLFPYKDSVGISTIGFGTTYYPNGTVVTLSDHPISKEEALLYLGDHIEHNVSPYIDKTFPDLTQTQYDSLCSFAYNLGYGALDRSSLKHAILTKDNNSITTDFVKWSLAGGKVLPGLVARRNAEAKLFLTGQYS